VVLSLFAVLNVILLLAAFAVRQPWADSAKQVAVPALPPELQDLQVRVASGHHDEPYSVSLTDAELTAALAHHAGTVPDVRFTGIQATILGDQVAVDAVTRGLAIPIPANSSLDLSQYDLPLTVDTLQLSPGNLAFAGRLK
jgi:hypothetical protein